MMNWWKGLVYQKEGGGGAGKVGVSPSGYCLYLLVCTSPNCTGMIVCVG